MRHKFNFGKPEDFPNADWISEHCFLIGAHQDYADNQINYLMEVLKKAAEI
jgi:dTDP-4-amino-4,6-dideoxygalactose transaminase